MKKIFLTLTLVASFIATAQVKIGDNPTDIDANSLLELESTTQGLLYPRVALTSTTSYAPLVAVNPLTLNVEKQAGMTVYNTATTTTGTNDVTPGLYVNDGFNWVKVTPKTLYTDNAAITSARTVTLNNNDLTFTAGVGGTGKTVVASTFKTGGAVYGNARVEANVLTSAAWLATDYVVIFTNASPTFTLPSATDNPGRIICVNNATGGNKTYVADATFNTQPKGATTLSGGKGHTLISIGNVWYVIAGQ